MSTDRVYHGKPCRRCGMTERYRCNSSCVHCERLRNKGEREWIRRLMRKYSITLLDYRAMLNRQGGVCAICGTGVCPTGKRFAVDHCHKTSRNRGILCKSCNIGLGELKDNPALLRRAAEYLEESVNVRGTALRSREDQVGPASL